MAEFTGRTFREADKRLGKRESLKIAWYTWLERRPDGSIAVRYHATDVVTYLPNGSFRLESGGWRTSTTKVRMQEYAPVSLYSERGIWYLRPNGKWPKFNYPEWDDPDRGAKIAVHHAEIESITVPYRDGMEVGPRGGVYGGGSKARVKAEVKDRKRINAFARAFGVALVTGEIPVPSGADCWLCMMFDAVDNKATPNNFNSYAGSRSRQGLKPHSDNSHLWSHIEEGYFVPTLLVNALEALGYGDAYKSQAWYHMTGDESYQWFRHQTQGESGGMYANAIRRYMLRRLGFSDSGPGIKTVKVA